VVETLGPAPQSPFFAASNSVETDLTKSEREALKAIYRFTRSGGEAHTGVLAEALGLSPGTVTSIVKRLAERGLVDHRPYQGVTFTTAGQRTAVAAIRRHRIVERFLADMLGYAWNEADKLAPIFEHELPGEVVDRMFVALHRPATCPHGFPIPEPEDDEVAATPELYALEPGDVAEVAVPGSTDPELVRFLETLGLVPGVEVEVIEKHPFDGPLVIHVNGQDRTLGERVARQIFVTPRATKQTTARRESVPTAGRKEDAPSTRR
jgi:DtxR family transcriptional regulator, Mn-dependent transcriptional regulator